MKGIVYSLSGKMYDFLDEYFEKARYKKVREKTLLILKGEILDAGCGTGRNLPYYSKSTRVLAVDNSEKMLQSARQRANKKSNIKIEKMDLTQLALPDNSFDVVVATFVLCTMPQKIEELALKELVRVVKPNGKLYFLEYVYSKNLLRMILMRLTSFIPKLLYGIRFNSTLPIIKKRAKVKNRKKGVCL